MCNCNKLYVVDPRSDLYAVDTVTGSSAYVGSVGIGSVTDIASYKGTMYGITFSDFLLIDQNSGHGVVVGPLGLTANGLAVNSKGEIFAGAGGSLAKIDPTTGAATIIGPFGGGLFSSGDLAFDSNDTLYASLGGSGFDVIARVDVNTGAASPVISTDQYGVYGLAFCCCHLYAANSSGELFLVHWDKQGLEFVGKTDVNVWGMTCGTCC
jgi:hypothetical protein